MEDIRAADEALADMRATGETPIPWEEGVLALAIAVRCTGKELPLTFFSLSVEMGSSLFLNEEKACSAFTDGEANDTE